MAIVIAVRGELDRAACVRLDALLRTVMPVPHPISLDVAGAWSRNGVALRRLCRFRSARHDAGLGCRLRGLHPGIISDLADADLNDVFAVWSDTRSDGIRDDGGR